MICELDSKPTRLSQSSVTTLSEFLPGYLIDIINVSTSFSKNFLNVHFHLGIEHQSTLFLQCIPEDKENSYLYMETCLYYLAPCFYLFDRSPKLTEQVLKTMRLMVSENTKVLESVQDREMGRNSLNLIHCIVSVILLMHNYVDVKMIISSSKSEIDLILQDVISLQVSFLVSLSLCKLQNHLMSD